MKRVIVVKVGGSLLDLPDLALRLDGWLQMQPAACHVLIAGGGALADAVRAMDQRLQLGDETAHWLAIDCLQITANVVHTVLPASQLITDWESLAAAVHGLPQRIVFAPAQFLRHVEPTLPGDRLSHSWRVSSDSIAARIARALNADSLVLLKSQSAETDGSPDAWATAGFVDEAFPAVAAELPRLQTVNLRDDRWQTLRTGAGDEC